MTKIDGVTGCRIVRETADVTPNILAAALDTLDWFNGRRIDWEEFIDRLASPDDPADPFDFEDYDNPAIRKIQRHVRQALADG